MFLDKPFMHNDFIFTAIVHTLLIQGILTKEELADKILFSAHSVERWSRGRNLPGKHVRAGVMRSIKEVLDKKFPNPS